MIAALGRWSPWLIGSALSLWMFWVDFSHSVGGSLDGKAFWGRDFVNLWAGGQMLWDGRAGDIYDVAAYREHLGSLFGPLGGHNYSYPPVTFPIAQAFSLLPYWLALPLWLGSTGALFVWAARRWWPKGWAPAWLAVLTPAAMMNIWAGHYGFLVGALFLLGWEKLDRRPWAAGLLFGLLLVKPHLAILVPLVLLLRGRWAALASGALTVAALVAATSAIYGWSVWPQFLFGAGTVQAGLIDAGASFYGYMSTSLATAILRLADNPALAFGAQALLGAAAVAMVALAARRPLPSAELAMLAATATFLVLPYGFNYDLTVVMIASVRLWADPQATRPERWLAVTGFLSPQIGMLLAPLGIAAMPLMLAALFAGQLSRALRLSPPAAARAAPEAEA
ncbi:MAG TPA: glycosyltransferase family 87 protein [Sphingomicrobium sp.]|nr:glycosyltransferase family 87 protein [Sphingomicrobium sp.]